VPDQGCTVDASLLPSKTRSIFAGSLKICVVWHCRTGTQMVFSFIKFGLDLIILIDHNTDQNPSFYWTEVVHNK